MYILSVFIIPPSLSLSILLSFSFSLVLSLSRSLSFSPSLSLSLSLSGSPHWVSETTAVFVCSSFSHDAPLIKRERTHYGSVQNSMSAFSRATFSSTYVEATGTRPRNLSWFHIQPQEPVQGTFNSPIFNHRNQAKEPLMVSYSTTENRPKNL